MPDKYENEIEDILRRVEEVAPTEPSRKASDQSLRSQRSSQPRHGAGWRLPSISAGKVLVAGLFLLLIGALLKTLLIWVGLGLLALSYLLYYKSPRSISYEKRWRGRPVEDHDSSRGWFRRWFKG